MSASLVWVIIRYMIVPAQSKRSGVWKMLLPEYQNNGTETVFLHSQYVQLDSVIYTVFKSVIPSVHIGDFLHESPFSLENSKSDWTWWLIWSSSLSKAERFLIISLTSVMSSLPDSLPAFFVISLWNTHSIKEIVRSDIFPCKDVGEIFVAWWRHYALIVIWIRNFAREKRKNGGKIR